MGDNGELKAKLFTVHGKLQKVGYCSFAKTCADALGVAGWVRETEEGTVLAHAEGSDQQLDEFAWDLSRGARYARVERVDAADASVEQLEQFEVRR